MMIRDDVLARLTHPDVWGPGGLYPLEAFRTTGRGYLARCPSGTHPDRHPSFSMPRGTPGGSCFACGYRASWIDFVITQQGGTPGTHGKPFWLALRVLADRAGLTLPERPPHRPAPAPEATPEQHARHIAAEYLRQALQEENPGARTVREYLAARGVPPSHLPFLPVGALASQDALAVALKAAGCRPRARRATGLLEPYMARHPLIFIYTDGQEVTGFKGRVPDRAVKDVMNAKGFGGELEGRSLFGLDLAEDALAASQRVILVEGEFDCLALQSALLQEKGATAELVALGGTAKPTPEKFRTLKVLGAEAVYFAFDRDPAGTEAQARAIPMAWGEGLQAFVLPMPEGIKDPDEALYQLGLDRCLADVFSLDRAAPAAPWLIRHVVAPVQGTAARLALRTRTLGLVAAAPPPERAEALALAADAFDEPPAALETALRQIEAEAQERGRLEAERSRLQARIRVINDTLARQARRGGE